MPVPFSASSAYTQRSLLHAYTTPSRTTGEPVISPPVASFQRSRPSSAFSVYSRWSLEPKWIRPSATAGAPTISPPDWKRHLGVPVTASSV